MGVPTRGLVSHVYARTHRHAQTRTQDSELNPNAKKRHKKQGLISKYLMKKESNLTQELQAGIRKSKFN